jgi:exoribonuclease R
MADHNRKVNDFHTHIADESLVDLIDKLLADVMEKVGQHPSLVKVESEYHNHLAAVREQANGLIDVAKKFGVKVAKAEEKLDHLLDTTRNIRAGRTSIVMHRIMEHMCNLDKVRVSNFLDDLDNYAHCVVEIEQEEAELRRAKPQGKAGAH